MGDTSEVFFSWAKRVGCLGPMGPDARNSLLWWFLADVYPTLVCVLLRTGFRGWSFVDRLG
jgi:hypothetical protein